MTGWPWYCVCGEAAETFVQLLQIVAKLTRTDIAQLHHPLNFYAAFLYMCQLHDPTSIVNVVGKYMEAFRNKLNVEVCVFS